MRHDKFIKCIKLISNTVTAKNDIHHSKKKK